VLRGADSVSTIQSILIDSIFVGERERKDLGDIEGTAASIAKDGLWHPIIIMRNGELVAGYRRLTACKMLGHTHVLAHIFEDLTPREQKRIRINENKKRKDLNIEEDAAAISDYHMLCVQEEGTRWTQGHTAQELNIEQTTVSKYITLYREMKDPVIQKAVGPITTINTTLNAVRRIRERQEADKVYTLGTVPKVYTSPIIQADFNEWAPTYTGPKFNLLHCDFPYGINAHKSAGQNSALDVDYTDSPETFWTLFKTLSVHLDNFCAESAHIFFWFSPNIYCDVWNALKLLDGFKFEEHPLVWMRGENEGIAPDPNRRPRRVYEMAFFGWRNDRPIIKTKANIIQAPTTRKDHPHEKSEIALTHFFEMCADSATRLLDPTCGSGSALRAARNLGSRDLLGLDSNAEYARIAQRAFGDSGSGGGSEPSLSDIMEQREETGQVHDGHGGDTPRQQTAS
jgi:ParB/RepB/Spo0J family partition protein